MPHTLPTEPHILYTTPARKPRKPQYQRAETVHEYPINSRGTAIIEALFRADGGALADYQIQRLFFTGVSQMRLSCRMLFHRRYINRLTHRQRYAYPHMIYWLHERGAAQVAQQLNVPLKKLKWRSEPRWSWIEHDLKITDFRLVILEACTLYPAVKLTQWISSDQFFSDHDRVEFQVKGVTKRRNVIPDGFYAFTCAEYTQPHRFVVEIDLATEDNPRFAREKLLAAWAYLNSEVYKKRFGHNAGRWLIVTTGERRLKNMQKMAEKVLGKNAWPFHYSTFAAINPETVFTEPVWHQAGRKNPVPLLKRLPKTPLKPHRRPLVATI